MANDVRAWAQCGLILLCLICYRTRDGNQTSRYNAKLSLTFVSNICTRFGESFKVYQAFVFNHIAFGKSLQFLPSV
jgi:hypothetical protein